MKVTGFLGVGLIVGVSLFSPAGVHAEHPSVTQIKAKPVFPSPIEWVGQREPSERESAALSQAIETLEAHGIKAGFAAFEDFLKAHPKSAWSPSLRVHMAEYYQRRGRYSLAAAHWESAWNATKESNDPASQQTAVRSVAGWTRLLASIGEKEKVKALIDELDRRQLPMGSLATIVDETRGGLIKMNSRPGDSFRCGSYALGHVARALNSDAQFGGAFFEAESPDNGFKMSQLLELAETNGLPMAAAGGRRDCRAVGRALEAEPLRGHR